MSARSQPERLSDLFASAVHRLGAVWPDLALASIVLGVVAVIPPVIVHQAGRPGSSVFVTSSLSFGIAYFAFVGWVVLRGLPQRAARGRVVATYGLAVPVGLVAGFLLLVLQPFVVIIVPLYWMAVPAVAAGDTSAWRAPVLAGGLAVRNFGRTWAVWLVTMVFSAPVMVSMFLIVTAFSGGAVAELLALACSVPVVWPFSALFVRALYGDLTGRRVLAAEDRTDA
jgi:hypothetical protein